jgi:proteasome assembly chaperone (PAC2) family protein
MREEQNIIYSSKPTLRNPYIVCGFDGWVNSGNVSSGGINFFISQFKALKFAEMPTSHYQIFQLAGVQSASPVFKMQDGLIVETNLPKNQFFYAKNPFSDHDLILFWGTEPNLNWEEYANTVVGLATDFGSSMLVALGGLPQEIPYTREPRMTCTCTSPKVREEMDKYNVMFSNREGPATFNQMLLLTCKEKGLDGINLNVRVPYYPQFNIGFGHNPKSIKAVLIRLNHILHLKLNYDELDSAIDELQGKLDMLRRQNPQFNGYIEDMEKEYVEMPFNEPFDISPSEAIQFAEDFLKENKENR